MYAYGLKYNIILSLIKFYNNALKIFSVFIFDKTARKQFRIKYSIYKKGFSVSPWVKRPPSGYSRKITSGGDF